MLLKNQFLFENLKKISQNIMNEILNFKNGIDIKFVDINRDKQQ